MTKAAKFVGLALFVLLTFQVAAVIAGWNAFDALRQEIEIERKIQKQVIEEQQELTAEREFLLSQFSLYMNTLAAEEEGSLSPVEAQSFRKRIRSDLDAAGMEHAVQVLDAINAH